MRSRLDATLTLPLGDSTIGLGMTGETFRKLREQMGLTQAELAARLGVESNSISRWEVGTRSIPPMAGKFMNLLLRMHRFDQAEKRRRKRRRVVKAELKDDSLPITKLVADLKRALEGEVRGRRRSTGSRRGQRR